MLDNIANINPSFSHLLESASYTPQALYKYVQRLVINVFQLHRLNHKMLTENYENYKKNTIKANKSK